MAKKQRPSAWWIKQVKAFDKTDMSRAKFAKKIGVAEGTFNYWYARFGKDSTSAKRAGSKPRVAKVNNFAELTGAVPVFTIKRGAVEVLIPMDADLIVVANLIEAMEA